MAMVLYFTYQPILLLCFIQKGIIHIVIINIAKEFKINNEIEFEGRLFLHDGDLNPPVYSGCYRVGIIIRQYGHPIAKPLIADPGKIDAIFHEVVVHHFGPCYGHGHIGCTADIPAELDHQCRIVPHILQELL